MSDTDNNNENQKPAVDLSGLSNLQFSTAWTPSSNTGASGSGFGGRRDFKSGRPDRRRQDKGDFKKRQFSQKPDGERKFGGRPKFKDANSQADGEKKPFKRFDKKFDKSRKPLFVPTMEVLFYPDDAPFNKLADIMKSSKRTYQLFDIAELVLEKPDRFIVLAKNLPDAEGNIKPLYCAQPLNLPFDDEQAAKNAAVEYYVEDLFTVEQIDAEPPKGSFQVVNKCSVTGDLLGAPNWHKYNEYLREYHREHFANKSFEEFTSTIESVRDEEQINAWLEQMKKRNVYKLKNPVEGENDVFDTREAAANHVISKMGAELVKAYEQVRMRGVNLAKMPFGRIRRNIEETIRKQKRFPIVTANNLRGRLRRSGFVVYKRGSNGFAFVSAVRRKFLLEGDTLSELPQKLFEFITANPAVTAAELPYKFLGLEVPTHTPKAKSLAEQDKEGGAQETVPEPATAELDEAAQKSLNSALSELLWLISEGYVVEYADSTLQANPYLPRPKDKTQSAEEQEQNLGAADEPIMSAKKKEDAQEKPVKGEIPAAADLASPKEIVAEEKRDENEEIAQEKQDEEEKK